MSAFSFSRQIRQTIKTNNNPGIGTYHTQNYRASSKIKTSPSLSIGKQPKIRKDKFVVPGPGTYNTQNPRYDSDKGVTILGKYKQKNKTQGPSPVHYELDLNYPSKLYSFGNSKRQQRKSHGPGPSDYFPQDALQSCSVAFGKQKRETLYKSNAPGPGHYHIQTQNNSSEKKLSPAYVFPRAQKLPEEAKAKNYIPGPGKYEISSIRKVFKGGKFPTSRRTMDIQTDIPGPGSYQSQKDQFISKHSPVAKFGQSSRENTKDFNFPGPGSYKQVPVNLYKKNYCHAVVMTDRGSSPKNDDNPGPGSYNNLIKNRSPAFSMTGRNFFTKKQSGPGPQTYDPKPQKVMSLDRRPSIVSEQKFKTLKNTIVPGPGKYELDIKQKTISYFFPKSTSKEKQEISIGPGSYKLKPSIGMYNGRKQTTKDTILYI